MERSAVEGDSPLHVEHSLSLSKAGHVKSCLNMGRPLSKPKYSCMTDSEPVPRGKGEKHPDKGSERVPETDCLQTVGACKGDHVPFV